MFFSCNCAAAFAENKKRNKNKKLTLENADIPFNKESDGRVLNGFLYISNLGAKVLSVFVGVGVCVWRDFNIFERESAAFRLLLSGAIETSSVPPELIYSLVNTFKTNSFTLMITPRPVCVATRSISRLFNVLKEDKSGSTTNAQISENQSNISV